MKRVWHFIVDQLLLNPLVQGSFALIFALLVWFLWSDQRSDRQWLSQFQKATQITLSELQDHKNGDLVVFDAIVAENNPLVDGEFVASITEYYDQELIGQSSTWMERRHNTPRLWLQDDTGTIRLTNEDWQADLQQERRDAEPTAFEGAKRTRGLLVGDQVSVLAKVVQGSELELQALRLHPGDYATFRSDLEAWVGINSTLINVSFVLLLITGTLTAIGARRFWQELQGAGEQARAAHSPKRS